jgi:hypothetical protein
MPSYWTLASTSSYSQTSHQSESEEKGQLQSRWSALSFLKLKHRQRFKSQSQVDADWFQNTSVDYLFLKKRYAHAISCLQLPPIAHRHSITICRALFYHSKAYFFQSNYSRTCISFVLEIVVVFS